MCRLCLLEATSSGPPPCSTYMEPVQSPNRTYSYLEPTQNLSGISTEPSQNLYNDARGAPFLCLSPQLSPTTTVRARKNITIQLFLNCRKTLNSLRRAYFLDAFPSKNYDDDVIHFSHIFDIRSGAPLGEHFGSQKRRSAFRMSISGAPSDFKGCGEGSLNFHFR